MRPLIPKTKASDLLDRFSEFAVGATEIDPFTLARFEKEAKQEIKHDAITAYMVLGAISAIRFDIDELHRYHTAAINLVDDEFTRVNYAISLQRIGLLLEAAIQAESSFRRCPEDIGFLNEAINMSWLAGRIEAGLALSREFAKRTCQEHENVDRIGSLDSVLRRTNVSEADYQHGIAIANAVLISSRIVSSGVSIGVDDDVRDESISYSLVVETSDERLGDLRNHLALRLCEEMGDKWRPDVLLFSFERVV